MIKKLLKKLFKKKDSETYIPIKPEIKVKPQFLIERQVDVITRDKSFPHNSYYSSIRSFFSASDIEVNTIFFIDTLQDESNAAYIKNNCNSITERLGAKGRNFHLLPKISAGTADFPFKRFFPSKYFNLKNFDGITANNYGNFSKAILNFLNYEGEIETGFITFFKGRIILVEKQQNESIEEYVDKYIETLPDAAKTNFRPTVLYSLKESDIEFDDEAKRLIDDLNKQIVELKVSGHFFLIAPYIKKMLEISPSSSFEPSSMHIDYDYKIKLNDYDLEIELSPLTKAIYFLFLQSQKPIDLKSIDTHRERLLQIYLKLSNRLSYDDLKASIEKVTEPNNTLIYMHLSRINSAFLKKIDNVTPYIISGSKGEPKEVLLDKNLIVWETEI